MIFNRYRLEHLPEGRFCKYPEMRGNMPIPLDAGRSTQAQIGTENLLAQSSPGPWCCKITWGGEWPEPAWLVRTGVNDGPSFLEKHIGRNTRIDAKPRAAATHLHAHQQWDVNHGVAVVCFQIIFTVFHTQSIWHRVSGCKFQTVDDGSRVNELKNFRHLVKVHTRAQQEVAVEHQRCPHPRIHGHTATLGTKALFQVRLIVLLARQRALGQGWPGIYVHQPCAWVLCEVVAKLGLRFFPAGGGFVRLGGNASLDALPDITNPTSPAGSSR